jgi:UDP-2,3-diacylglucosamine hydrolase
MIHLSLLDIELILICMSKTAYFLSDVHLRIEVDEVEIQRRKELYKLLDQIKDEHATLFIVGDWFDFYFEYGSVVSQAYYDVYAKLRELVEAGIDIHFFGGNHDYWLGDFMSKRLGIKIYLEGTTIPFNGKQFYLTHGDGLDPDDVNYRRMQTVLRHPLFIWAFRWIVHPNIGHAVARMISRRSKKKYRGETLEYLLSRVRKNYPIAEAEFESGADFFITGHIHYPKLKKFENGHFLTIGDFLQYFSFGYYDGLNLSLKQWPVKHLEQRELP